MRILAVLLLSVTIVSAQNLLIKSLKASKAGSELLPPILVDGEKLKVEFDVESSKTPDFKIVFRFCDQNWKPVENIFLQNNGFNIEHNLWFDKLPTSVRGADYRYEGVFPNGRIKFPFSGKWKFYITDGFDTSQVFAEGKFIYVKNIIPLDVSIRNERLQGRSTDPSIFGQIYNITTKFILPDTLEDFRIKNVEIIKNQSLEFPIIITKDFTGSNKYFEWNGHTGYQFTVNDVQPGKEYRQADLRDIHKYSSPSTNAHFDGKDLSRLYESAPRDFNGAYKLVNFKNDYAEYMNVTFELRAPEKYYDDVYLVGSFTNWHVYPEFKMYLEDDNLYYLTVELKRGVYDYQYVTGLEEDGVVNNINWLIIEGNDWNTTNDYYVFVYYDSAKKGGYEEIIGYQKIYSGKK
ncbi:MAG: hypothetical protein CVV23_02435 [Ignavibacteriae bacterium HGW-Ignavibacteriae-2]|nr:MAG: hypothetical protein CVV23_02435 [Ignavibacteriae bacterium HGW-Ignavibacteriae-2]